MTVPPPPALSPPFVPPTPPAPAVQFPLGWLLDHAAGPIQCRAVCEVAKLGPPLSTAVARLPYLYPPALRLAVTQHADGTWGSSMLGVPGPRADYFEGVGTINAVRRLLEYGWDRESPPLLHARRILFRLLAEDDDPAFAFEFAGRGKTDPDLVRRGRIVLREAASAALAQAGYEGDPRLRGAAQRITDRIQEFLTSPLAEKPFVRVGNKHLLSPDAYPPSFYSLQMLAYMPLFRSERAVVLERIRHYLERPLPRQEVVQQVGTHAVAQPHLVLGDMLPNRNVVDADVPWALAWLELVARLGFLQRSENWTRLFDRMLDDRDAEGVWHPHKGLAVPRSTNALVWPAYPLESERTGDERWTDVTFRLGLIARLAGRTIDIG